MILRKLPIFLLVCEKGRQLSRQLSLCCVWGTFRCAEGFWQPATFLTWVSQRFPGGLPAYISQGFRPPPTNGGLCPPKNGGLRPPKSPLRFAPCGDAWRGAQSESGVFARHGLEMTTIARPTRNDLICGRGAQILFWVDWKKMDLNTLARRNRT